MAAKKHHSILAIFLILILFVNLVNVQSVLADGETPTEPPAETEVVTEEPTEPPVEATPVPVESTPEPVESEATPTPVAEILTEVPESTEVVVLDESGNPVPLATEEAAESVEILDPMWCPAGVLPGGTGCTGNYNSVSELVTAMSGDPLFYNEPGIIYFIATTGNQAAGSFSATTQSLGDPSYNIINDFDLTLQGGWNGANGASATFTGVTNFGTNTVTIGTNVNRWVGNITINNIQFNGVSSSNAALTVFTTSGSITLNNVDVNQQGNANTTANLNSTSGNIVVQNGSTFDGNGSNSSGFIASTGGSGSITISDTTFTDVVRLGAVTNDGATLSAPTVTLTNVTANSNDGNGIRINNANTVTLNNVIANTNGTAGGAPGLPGNVGSGVFISGTLSSPLIINGGIFNNNARYGVELQNAAYVQLNPAPTCEGNVGGCFSSNAIADSTPPDITPIITGTAGSNGWYQSNVTVNWSITDSESGIPSSSVCSASTLTAETAGTTLTCSATNRVGLSNSVSVTIKIDKTGPTAVLSVISGTLGNNGWYVSDVTVGTSGTDSLSNPVTCTADQILSADTAGAVVNGSCTNAAGLTTDASSITIKIDKTAPTAALSIISGTLGNNGWYISNVTVQTSGTDSTSNPVTCTADQTLSADTAGTVINGSCTNAAGLTTNASPITIKLDKTAPNLTLPGNLTIQATGPSGATVTYSYSVSDNLDANPIHGCSPISGSTFPLGSTTVSCSATDEAGNTANGSFQIIVQDTSAPVIEPHADVYAESKFSEGAKIVYTNPSATDVVDGSVPVNCSPASGSRFPLGYTLVTCTATDSNGNTATSSFWVFVKDTKSSSSSTSTSTSFAFIVPLTGGQLIDLDCNSVFWAFGIKLSYLNLCDQQTSVDDVSASDLPAKLPAGFSFVRGLHVDVLTNGQVIKDLPSGAGIELDFPLYKETPDQFVVLYWSDEDGDGKGQWIEISKQINKDQISQTLKSGSGDELYQLSHTDTEVFYPILTTNNTGIFVLAKK